MAKNKQDSFWTSYSDLMTSLFFVMLVLFIICLVKIGGANRELKDKQGQLEHLLDSVQATNEQLRNILQLEEQFKVLSQSTSLEYDSEKKMFFAKDFQNKEIFRIIDTNKYCCMSVLVGFTCTPYKNVTY